ncbi:MAG: calycin-like domain-containing protein [Muribaculaceae bacterium]|nr:calycin-like domain-containing protein [Muribaculaceae bacterium]
MKKTILASLSMAMAITAMAQTEVLKITLNDGSEHTFNVADVAEMTFAEEELPLAQQYAGTYTGVQTVDINGMWQYQNKTVTYVITAAEDGTITVSIPEYSLDGTMMGDLTLGAITLDNLVYDESKNGFYRSYGNDGLTQHFKAVQNGTTNMDKDYTLGNESSILVTLTETGIKVTNPFKLGAMPFPLTATYEGTKN